ncbi:thioredoxin family protein [Jiulongibacter sp. NS-SX5]|uniref:thioredoxin family protein n=1 Tax=Jiulongibacter sp. NS-SX5 TaxID=3463854 RepID=UPI004059CF1E
MKSLLKLSLLSLLLTVLIVQCTTIPTNTRTVVKDEPPKSIINYHKGSYESFLLMAQNQNKPILLEFWASWCGPCIRMDNETYSDRALGHFINQNFVMYKIDADSFDGLEAAGKYGIDSYPALLVLSPDGELKEYIKGFYLPNSLQSMLKKHL